MNRMRLFKSSLLACSLAFVVLGQDSRTVAESVPRIDGSAHAGTVRCEQSFPACGGECSNPEDICKSNAGGTACVCKPRCHDDTECPGKCERCDLATNTCFDIPGCCDEDADCPVKCERCDFLTTTCFDIPGCCELDADCPAKCADCDLATNTCFVPGCCAACVWDIDGSGDVRVPDLIKLLSCWGPLTGDPLCACLDIDTNGDIRVPDLIALLAKWGTCP